MHRYKFAYKYNTHNYWIINYSIIDMQYNLFINGSWYRIKLIYHLSKRIPQTYK